MKNSTTLIAFITALALHLIVGAVMLLGLDFSLLKEPPKKEVVVINASMVNKKLFDDLAQKKAQIEADKLAAAKRKAEQIRQEKARVKREKQLAEKRRRAAEAKRIQAEKDKLARQKKEEERILFEKIVAAKELRAKKEAEKAKKIADAKRKKEEAERVEAERIAAAKALKEKQAEAKRIEAEKIAAAKALKEKQEKEAKIKAEKLAAEKAAKIKAEKERQRKAAEAERLRQAELDRQMEAEFDDAFSDAKSSKQLSEIARYKALIQDKISRNWQVEPSMKGKTCTLAIRLAPDGLVLSANRSHGDQKLCDSAKRATLKAKTLPIPKDPDIAPQFRDFDITLEPDL